jgi:lipid-A-disaccharide synthase
MRYYIIAGEASGDLHGANLVRELKLLDKAAEIRGWGGDKMQEQGVSIVKHYRDLAFMGFVEVVANLNVIIRNLNFCKKDILEFKPDVVILIDYPGFNLRIAEFLKQKKIKNFYYISPQIWAWKQSRVHKIKRDVDKMFVILPFEKAFYKKFNMDVEFVGHPLLDAIEQFKNREQKTNNSFKRKYSLSDKKIIALLPGSRQMEIKQMLPVMKKIVESNQQFQFVIAGTSSIPESFYRKYVTDNVKIIFNESYNLLLNAHAALVTSGTATLETALFKIPQVVCYKGNLISYHIARNLIKIKYISLVNLILDKAAVKELIQQEMNPEMLQIEFEKIVSEGDVRNNILYDYNNLIDVLGSSGASKKAAEKMFQLLSGRQHIN